MTKVLIEIVIQSPFAFLSLVLIAEKLTHGISPETKIPTEIRGKKTDQRSNHKSFKRRNYFYDSSNVNFISFFCLRFHFCFFQFQFEKSDSKEDFIGLRLYNRLCRHSELIHFASLVYQRPFESLLCYPFVQKLLI